MCIQEIKVMSTDQQQQTESAYDNPAFRDTLRKLINTPKEEVERGLAEEERQRQQRKLAKSK